MLIKRLFDIYMLYIHRGTALILGFNYCVGSIDLFGEFYTSLHGYNTNQKNI